jgi:hypothetical protein
LWRQRETGRRASIVFWGSICLYYLLGLTFFRTSGTRYGYTFLAIFCSLIALALLFSARQRPHVGLESQRPDPFPPNGVLGKFRVLHAGPGRLPKTRLCRHLAGSLLVCLSYGRNRETGS